MGSERCAIVVTTSVTFSIVMTLVGFSAPAATGAARIVRTVWRV
jgi:hypothetical protein